MKRQNQKETKSKQVDEVEKETMTNEETSKKKRTHSRSFYMAVNPKGGAIVTKKQLPVFWSKAPARELASKINGKAVKVTMSWV